MSEERRLSEREMEYLRLRLIEELDKRYATRNDVAQLQRIAYAAVSMICLTVLAALLSLVVRVVS